MPLKAVFQAMKMQDTNKQLTCFQRKRINLCISLDTVLSFQSTVPFYGFNLTCVSTWSYYFQRHLILTRAKL